MDEATRLAALERLEAFLCEWNMEASFASLGVTGRIPAPILRA